MRLFVDKMPLSFNYKDRQKATECSCYGIRTNLRKNRKKTAQCRKIPRKQKDNYGIIERTVDFPCRLSIIESENPYSGGNNLCY